jgi:hypothetical protein
VRYFKATRCACGCGRQVRPRTPNRPARFIHGHNTPPRRRRPIAERFWEKVAVGALSDCWPWLGGACGGYGRIWDTDMGSNRRATEVALVLSGITVPPGAMVCHHCDTPRCVNPAHLYVGDAATNVADMDRRGRRRASVPHPAARGERNHNAKLTDAEVRAIRARYTGLRGEQSALAREYGVTPQLVQMVVRGGHRGVL